MTILAEKESVAKNYVAALSLEKKGPSLFASQDGKIKLTYAAGHLYSLCDASEYDPEYKKWTAENLPIIPENYRYEAIQTKEKFRQSCEKVLKAEREEIVIATDPDREGEVIGRLILEGCGIRGIKISRAWCREGLDTREIKRALQSRKDDGEYQGLYLQGKCQKESDWVLGINLTRCYTIMNGRELFSVGRCQTAVLKELYRRQMEILSFRKEKYYTVRVDFSDGSSGRLKLPDGEDRFENKVQAERMLEKVRNLSFTVAEKTSERKIEKVPMLYDLVSLQKDAFHFYAIDVDETLSVCQSLYNELGVISYPRADSRCLGDDDVEMAREIYERLNEMFPAYKGDIARINDGNKRMFSTPNVGAHHAIIPGKYFNYMAYTGREGINSDPEKIKKIYDLILRRFFIQGYPDYEEEKIEAVLTSGQYTVVCEGKKIIENGWHEKDLTKREKEKNFDADKGDVLEAAGGEVEERWTEGPKFYNQASLISFMQDPFRIEGEERKSLHSIGTEATQATIIKILFDRKYIDKVKNHIEITDRGIKLVEQVSDNKVLDVNTDIEATTRWEEKGKENPLELLKEIEEVTRNSVEAVRKKMIAAETKVSVGKCPSCGKDILKGRGGYYCSGYKEGCRVSLKFHVHGHEMNEAVMKDVLEGKDIPWMKGVKKDGSSCIFSVKYLTGEIRILYSDEREEVCKCMKCSSPVFQMKKVYKCSSPDCDFFIWKETSGMKFSPSNVRDLCSGKEIKVRRTSKAGTVSDVMARIDPDKMMIAYRYIDEEK